MQLLGRSSSHYTRVTRIVAAELGVELELVPIYDLTGRDPAVFGGNPALKLPSLRIDGALVFGTENICRRLAAIAAPGPRVVLPEHVDGDVARNAQELVWHAMAAQVQLVLGPAAGIALDNAFLAKIATGFHGALAWLDANLEAALAELPAPRTVSLLEVSLFCLVEHLAFRPTISAAPYATLRGFADVFATRPAAQRTPYRFDPKPA